MQKRVFLRFLLELVLTESERVCDQNRMIQLLSQTMDFQKWLGPSKKQVQVFSQTIEFQEQAVLKSSRNAVSFL